MADKAMMSNKEGIEFSISITLETIVYKGKFNFLAVFNVMSILFPNFNKPAITTYDKYNKKKDF